MGTSRDKKLYDKTKLTMTGWFNTHYKRLQQRERTKFGKDLPFDRWELEKWIIDTQYDVFVKLFKDYVDCKYDTDLVPSIDRLDNTKGYSFENMQVITWKNNKEKDWQSKEHQDTTHMTKTTKRQVARKLNNEIKYYESISQASKENNISTSIICECCQGKRKTGKGYRWYYV